jgi:hypothetical protein
MNATEANNCGIVSASVHGGEHFWRCPSHGEHFSRCAWCGSIHPDDLIEARRSKKLPNGTRWADQKYGWPHKFYVDIADVKGELHWLGGWSGGLEPPTDEEVRARGYTPIAALTEAERTACEKSVLDLSRYHGVQVGRRAWHHAKFYTAHLNDDRIEDGTKIEIARLCGLRFEFEDGRVRWRAFDYEKDAA